MADWAIVYAQPGYPFVFFVPDDSEISRLKSIGLDDSQVRETLRRHAVPPDATDVMECTQADIGAADRTFRDAWRRDGARPIRVDMPAARQIHRQRLEQRAAEKARELREQYLEAEEDGDTARAQQLRQRARGMRQRIAALDLDAAQTPEELAAITDEELDDQQTLRGGR